MVSTTRAHTHTIAHHFSVLSCSLRCLSFSHYRSIAHTHTETPRGSHMTTQRAGTLGRIRTLATLTGRGLLPRRPVRPARCPAQSHREPLSLSPSLHLEVPSCPLPFLSFSLSPRTARHQWKAVLSVSDENARGGAKKEKKAKPHQKTTTVSHLKSGADYKSPGFLCVVSSFNRTGVLAGNAERVRARVCL